MATCHSCGSELTGPYCNECGAKAQVERAARKPRKEAPKALAAGSARPARTGAAPQGFWKQTALALLGLALFAGGMITGFWLGTGSSNGQSGIASLGTGDPDFGDMPPAAVGGLYMDEGVAYMGQSNRTAAATSFRKAVTYFDRALKEDPDNLYARTYLGLTHFYLGDSTKALAELRETLNRDPNYLWAIFNLAWIYETAGKQGESLVMYKKYLAVVDQERELPAKYAEQYELIDRQIEVAQKAVAGLSGGDGK